MKRRCWESMPISCPDLAGHRAQPHRGGLGRAGDTFDQRVRHHLPPAALILIGRHVCVGGAGECGVAGHCLADRQQRGQIRHRLGRRPQPHPPFGLGAGAARDEALRIQPVGECAGFGLQPPVTPLGQPRRQLRIDPQPV
jgi:hypothetical protein